MAAMFEFHCLSIASVFLIKYFMHVYVVSLIIHFNLLIVLITEVLVCVQLQKK